MGPASLKARAGSIHAPGLGDQGGRVIGEIARHHHLAAVMAVENVYPDLVR